jgi:hypothetical protein
MNRKASFLSFSLALACLLPTAPACYVEKPENVADAQLGYSVTFPGRPTRSRYIEQTPFGEVEWYAATYTAGSRFDQIFSVDVGTLPPGEVGGAYQEDILQTLKDWIMWRFPGSVFDLDQESGPGFEYASKNDPAPQKGQKGPDEPWSARFMKRLPKRFQVGSRGVRGIFVLRRGRLHHAKGVAEDLDDPRLIAFLQSFRVDSMLRDLTVENETAARRAASGTQINATPEAAHPYPPSGS